MDNAVVLAEGVFGTTYGKTANGLVRYSRRFRITSVLDSRYAGQDAGFVLAGVPNGITIVSSISEAVSSGADTLIVGVATDGGFIPDLYRGYIAEALRRGMSVVSGLHEFISDDPEFSVIAGTSGSVITDVRKMFRDRKDFFTGRISQVGSKRIAVLGTDSAIGKRTTAVYLTKAMNDAGHSAVMIGTGQTAWMQGFEHTIVLDSMINDFIAGALESVTYEAWVKEKPEYMFIEGQGSVLHPAYPGSFEIIGACRPDAVILQHAPSRIYFDGFEGYRIPDPETYIRILELLSGKKVIAISLNTENMKPDQVPIEKEAIEKRLGIPVFNPLEKLDEIAGIIAAGTV